jgi:hypothetical protein
VESLEVLCGVLERACRETTNRLTFLSIIEPDAPPPDREGRIVVRRCIEVAGARTAAAGFLALGPGAFTLVAPIINAAVFLSRIPISTRFFCDQRLALEWIAQSATGGATFESLTHHVNEMGRLIDQVETAPGVASTARREQRSVAAG